MVEVSLHDSLGLHVGKEVPKGYLGLMVAIRNPLLVGSSKGLIFLNLCA